LTSGEPLLHARGLRKEFDGVRVLDVEALDVPGDGVTALIGPNGAGKTTLFDVVTGFVRGRADAIRFGGRSIAGRPPHVIARGGLARTFQLTRVLERLTVLENVAVAGPGQHGERLHRVLLTPRAVRSEKRRLREQARAVLEIVALADLSDAPAGELSGGQKKLLELARALMLAPRMLLLDEPLAGVNPTLRRDLMETVGRLRDRGIAVLLIEHDMEAVMRSADRVLVMADGSLIASGSPEKVRRNPDVLDAYLGVAEDPPA
jgi:neutral amino acid transport system ATP-binding protein